MTGEIRLLFQINCVNQKFGCLKKLTQKSSSQLVGEIHKFMVISHFGRIRHKNSTEKKHTSKDIIFEKTKRQTCHPSSCVEVPSVLPRLGKT